MKQIKWKPHPFELSWVLPDDVVAPWDRKLRTVLATGVEASIEELVDAYWTTKDPRIQRSVEARAAAS